jgi:hypothetical protein
VIVIVRKVNGSIFFDDDAVRAVEGGFQGWPSLVADPTAASYGAYLYLVGNL